MQAKPSLHSYKTSVSSNTVSNTRKTSLAQHANRTSHIANPGKERLDEGRCFLLSLPTESITHITTYVDDPRSLVALARTNRLLRDHIAEDNTWYRAFAFHFWGLGPEEEPSYETNIMLRKTENTWKKEYVKRFETLRCVSVLSVVLPPADIRA